jgi:photosystem II stability/assembly factor-like uncharacterized protein
MFQESASQSGWTIHGSNLSSIYCIKAVDQNTAWIAGDSGAVSRTTDGGSSWIPVGIPEIPSAPIWNIDAINSKIAFVTATPSSTSYIYRTTNGGSSWSQVFYQSGGFINDIHMTDLTNGFAYGDPVGGKWTVLTTTDGGATWARLPNEPAPVGGEVGLYYNSLTVVGSSHLWFAATSNRIYRSTDSGESWSFGTLPASPSVSVWFNTVDLGLATSNASSGVRSTDSGLTWEGISLSGSGTPYFMAGAGSTDFWYASNEIYRSTDKGSSWTQEVSGIGHQWFALDFVTIGNSAVGYAASFGGAIARYSGTITSIHETTDGIPAEFTLEQNYPNPFNPRTKIRFHLPQSEQVTLTVFNSTGEKMETLVSQSLRAGTYSVEWNAQPYASGIYFYKLEAAQYVQTRKMILLR